MKLRELLKKFRRRSPQVGDDERSANSVNDALTTVGGAAPTNLVPSQQDERPRH